MFNKLNEFVNEAMHCIVPFSNHRFVLLGKSRISTRRLTAMATRDFCFWIDRGGTFTDVIAEVGSVLPFGHIGSAQNIVVVNLQVEG